MEGWQGLGGCYGGGGGGWNWNGGGRSDVTVIPVNEVMIWWRLEEEIMSPIDWVCHCSGKGDYDLNCVV